QIALALHVDQAAELVVLVHDLHVDGPFLGGLGGGRVDMRPVELAFADGTYDAGHGGILDLAGCRWDCVPSSRPGARGRRLSRRLASRGSWCRSPHIAPWHHTIASSYQKSQETTETTATIRK